MTDTNNTLAPTDAEILALNTGEVHFSESPSKYPAAGFGTQYHAGAPGVLSFARAVLAKWGGPAPSPQAQPVAVPAGMEPYAQHAIWNAVKPDDLVWTQYHDASDPMPKAWDDEAPDVVVDLFTAAQVQAMIAQRFVYGESHVRHTQDSGPAPVPLSDEQIEALARKHGATSYRNRSDTQHPAYGFTPAGLLNLIAEVLAEVRKHDHIADVREMVQVAAEEAAAAEREECARVCCEIEDDLWALYKGRLPYTGREPERGDPHTDGRSDGAGECAAAIRARSAP